jgi:hypothetical protein
VDERSSMPGLFRRERFSLAGSMQEERCEWIGRFLPWFNHTLLTQETMCVVPFGGIFRTGVRLPSSPLRCRTARKGCSAF